MAAEPPKTDAAVKQSPATPGYPDRSRADSSVAKRSWRHYMPATIAALVLLIALIIVLKVFILNKH